MAKETEFKPYIPADKVTPELTVTSIIIGVLLAIIFGAANAYLGLRVGMTVSASIPAAVISMGIIRLILRRNSILENNISQTIGSAGESLASGAIFTLPAIFLWAAEGKCDAPGILEIGIISLCGGVLGVMFMIPLRNALIVKEHATLPYPEGTACADVLKAGEAKGSQARSVVAGIGIGAVLKFLVDGFKLVKSDITIAFDGLRTQLAAGAYPALIGVGYIIGHRVSFTCFAGSVVSWLVIIPLICMFGGDQIISPGTDTISALYVAGGAEEIWSNYVRYIGAGAIVTGGIISLIKTLPIIAKTFKDSISSFKNKESANSKERTSQDLSFKTIIILSVAMILILWLTPFVSVDIVGALAIVVCGFFFATVSSRIVGIVGASNNPVSGLAIATLLVSTFVLITTGHTGIQGMVSAIVITSVVCIITTIADDTSQDLKTGFLLGATPKKQQIGELIGVVATALTMGGILYLLNDAWGFGTAEVPAPQATLMKTIAEGIMEGALPWNLVFIGVALGLTLELVGIPCMTFAIGVYLPVSTTATMAIGGALRWFVERRKKVDASKKEEQIKQGTLFSAGLIAGEGLIGILLAFLAIAGVTDALDFSNLLNIGNAGPVFIIVILILCIFKFTIWSKCEVAENKEE